MNYYAKLVIVILLVIGAAQFAPEAVNVLLLLILAGMVLMQSGQFAALIAALKL